MWRRIIEWLDVAAHRLTPSRKGISVFCDALESFYVGEEWVPESVRVHVELWEHPQIEEGVFVYVVCHLEECRQKHFTGDEAQAEAGHRFHFGSRVAIPEHEHRGGGVA